MEFNPFSLKNKTILVTGASSGIGKAVAIECSKIGATLLISGRNSERLNETYCLLEGLNHNQISSDLCNPDELTSLVEKLPLLDGIVHSAGIYRIAAFPYLKRKDLDETFEINFTAPVLLSQLLLRSRKMKKNSSIVFISSISGVMCSEVGVSAYSASKGAISGIVKSMALDLAHHSIRVNCVMPGMIDTKLTLSNLFTKEQVEEDIKRYPLKRYGKPEEVAYAVIYLLSDASKWITGSNLLIDGGFTLK